MGVDGVYAGGGAMGADVIDTGKFDYSQFWLQTQISVMQEEKKN